MGGKALCILLWVVAVAAAEEVTLDIGVTSAAVADSQTVYICGNHALLGSWHPAKVPMQQIAPDRWRFRLRVPRDSQLEFKFTLGSWATEAVDSLGKPFANFKHRAERDTVLHYVFSDWTRSSPIDRSGQVTGTLRFHRDLAGDGIAPRDVVVWLPPGYDENVRQRFPALYMHDGQNLFDPATAAFGVDWQLDETLDSLIREGRIDPVIAVGIYNSPRRRTEYGVTELGEDYRRFVSRDLKHFIDREYRTRRGRRSNWMGGSSMGGLVSFLLAWENPRIYAGALCMSPAFKVDSIDVIRTLHDREHYRPPVRLYIDNGDVGLEQRLQPGIDEMLQVLKSRGYREGRDFLWRKEEGASHAETAWARRLPEALLWLLR